MKVLEFKTFQFRNKKHTCNPDFLVVSLLAVRTLLEENCKFVNQTL